MRLPALVGLALAACGGTKAPASSTAPAPASAPAAEAAVAPAPPEPEPPPADAEGIVVLDAGAEPRAALRFAIKDKTKRKVELEMAMAPEGSKAKPTPRTMGWTYSIKRDGDAFRITMKVTKADQRKGKSASWRINDRGRHDAPGADSAQQLVQATQAEHMLPIFPTDPIGVGARWTVPVAVSAGLGVAPAPGITTWELRSVEGTRVVAHGQLAVSADEVAVRDVTMRLEIEATIDTTIDLASYTGKATTEMKMVSTPSGGKTSAYVSHSVLQLR